jgi:hypothetical protein
LRVVWASQFSSMDAQENPMVSGFKQKETLSKADETRPQSYGEQRSVLRT